MAMSNDLSAVFAGVKKELVQKYGSQASLEQQIAAAERRMQTLSVDHAEVLDLFEALQAAENPVAQRVLREKLEQVMTPSPTYISGLQASRESALAGHRAEFDALSGEFASANPKIFSLYSGRLASASAGAELSDAEKLSVLEQFVAERGRKKAGAAVLGRMVEGMKAINSSKEGLSAVSGLVSEYSQQHNQASGLKLQLADLQESIASTEDWLGKRTSPFPRDSDGEWKYEKARQRTAESRNTQVRSINTAIAAALREMRNAALIGDGDSLNASAVRMQESMAAYKAIMLDGADSPRLDACVESAINVQREVYNQHQHQPLFTYIGRAVAGAKDAVAKLAKHVPSKGLVYTIGVGTLVAGAIGIAALVYNPKSDTPDLSNYATSAQVAAVDGKVDGNRYAISGLEDDVNYLKDTLGLVAPATQTPVPTATPYAVPTATPQPTATATPRPTATATPRPTATPILDDLAGIRSASSYGLSYGLAEAMYSSNPSGFVAAFGVVPQAASQVPNWFDGNPANSEAVTIDGKVMTVNGGNVHVNLLPDGRGAEFTADPAKAKTFVVDYLAANPSMVRDVVIGGN